MSELACAVTLEVHPEHLDEFIKQVRMLAAETRKEDGNIQYDLCQDLQNSNCIMIIERWKSKEALDLHLTLPHFQKFISFVPGKAEEKSNRLMSPIEV